MEDLKGIKNILFDLGGVLLNIDFKKTFDAFAALGIEDAHGLNDRPEVLELFMGLERGEFGKEAFLGRFRELVLVPAGPRFRGDDNRFRGDDRGFRGDDSRFRQDDRGGDDEQIIDAFNALLLDFVPERIELVQKLRSKYRCFLLSNTNAIHAECYNKRLKENFGIENLDHLMERAFYSHDLGCRKPDPEIYLKALELAGIKAEETMFIDDSQENVDAALKLGIQGVRVDEEYTIVEVFG